MNSFYWEWRTCSLYMILGLRGEGAFYRVQFPQGISAEIFSWKSVWLRPRTFQHGTPKEEYVNLLQPRPDSWKSGSVCSGLLLLLSIGSVSMRSILWMMNGCQSLQILNLYSTFKSRKRVCFSLRDTGLFEAWASSFDFKQLKCACKLTSQIV